MVVTFALWGLPFGGWPQAAARSIFARLVPKWHPMTSGNVRPWRAIHYGSASIAPCPRAREVSEAHGNQTEISFHACLLHPPSARGECPTRTTPALRKCLTISRFCATRTCAELPCVDQKRVGASCLHGLECAGGYARRHRWAVPLHRHRG
jgi:hypothetical protein